MDVLPMAGVYAAAVTPLKQDYSPDYEALPTLLDFLARRGCHGALVLGTTGEGPSFSADERIKIWNAALEVKEEHPEFRLLAGTGTPSLGETISLTKIAFEMGYDGVVMLPPYYFKNAREEGLYTWFCEVIDQSVPSGGLVIGYHFPQVSGVSLEVSLIKRLNETFPTEFTGLKDSSGDLNYGRSVVEALGEEFLMLVGNDRLFSRALDLGMQGCITALANLRSQELRLIWDAHYHGEKDEQAQGQLTIAREILESIPPTASAIKALLSGLHDLPRWTVRPPLLELEAEVEKQALREMMRVGII